MCAREHTEFPARLAALRDTAAFAQVFCERNGIDRHTALRLTLVIEELFTNTVQHGYRAESDLPFVPYQEGVTFQLVQIDIEAGFFVVRVRGEPGMTIQRRPIRQRTISKGKVHTQPTSRGDAGRFCRQAPRAILQGRWETPTRLATV